jgi:hypothetical protein
VKSFRLAAEQGDVDAQFALGVMYAMGRGALQDDAEAMIWFHKSATQGHADAQHNLDTRCDYDVLSVLSLRSRTRGYLDNEYPLYLYSSCVS